MPSCSLDLDIFVAAALLLPSSPHSLPCVRSLFDPIQSPDTFIFNTLIRSYLHSQNPTESLCLFARMRLVAGVSPDGFSLSLALQACGRSLQSRTGDNVHAQVVKLGFASDLFVETALVRMYAKVGDDGTARKVFDLMVERDFVACNVVLAEYVGCGEIGEARWLFRHHTVMRVSGGSVMSV